MKRRSLIKSFFGFIAGRIVPMILIVGCCIGAALLYLRNTSYQYATTMQVATVTIDTLDQGPSLPDTGFLELSSESDGLSPFKVYLHHLKSYRTAEILDDDEELVREMFPGLWDEESKTWIKKEGPLVDLRRDFAKFVNYPINTDVKPGSQAVWGFLQQNITIEEIDNSVHKLTLYVTDPEFGVRLLEKVHRTADDNARAFVVKSSRERLDLLEERYEQSPISEVRDKLIGLIVNYSRVAVMTEGGENFAAEPFQKPLAEKYPSRPKPEVVVALSGVAGVILFFLFFLVTEKRRLDRQNSPDLS